MGETQEIAPVALFTHIVRGLGHEQDLAHRDLPPCRRQAALSSCASAGPSDGADVQQDGLEAALAAAEVRIETAQREAAVAVRELKRARTAAGVGQLRDLRRALTARTLV